MFILYKIKILVCTFIKLLFIFLQTVKSLDRESKDKYEIIVKASENCDAVPANQSSFNEEDDTTLKVEINVVDINDNEPKFVRKTFTGGVTTDADFGTKFMSIEVIEIKLKNKYGFDKKV